MQKQLILVILAKKQLLIAVFVLFVSLSKKKDATS
jgi:hypothetical protein